MLSGSEAKRFISSSHSPSVLNHSNLAIVAEQDKPCIPSSTGRVLEDQSNRRKRKFGNASTLCLSAILLQATPLVSEEVVCNNTDPLPPFFGLMTFVLSMLEQKVHKELIALVRSSSSPLTAQCNASYYFSSQHKRKLRSLAPCPINDQLFVTRYCYIRMNINVDVSERVQMHIYKI